MADLNTNTNTNNGSDTEYDRVLFLHFGVNASGKRFELEKRAKNEASFRAPDERQFQPMNQPIIPTTTDGDVAADIERWLYTDIPVETLAAVLNATLEPLKPVHFPSFCHSNTTTTKQERLIPTKDPLLMIKQQSTTETTTTTTTTTTTGSTDGDNESDSDMGLGFMQSSSSSSEEDEKEHGAIAGVSLSAGRFVCNYIYYHSLTFTQRCMAAASTTTTTTITAAAAAAATTEVAKKKTSKMASLFVHIPSQDTIPLDSQYVFVRHLLEAVASMDW